MKVRSLHMNLGYILSLDVVLKFVTRTHSKTKQGKQPPEWSSICLLS